MSQTESSTSFNPDNVRSIRAMTVAIKNLKSFSFQERDKLKGLCMQIHSKDEGFSSFFLFKKLSFQLRTLRGKNINCFMFS